jgi:DNA polymerase III delta prime subunit
LFNLDIFGSLRHIEPVAIDLVSKASQNNKFSHAYLITGKNLDITNQFVQVFSKILLCNSKTANDNCINCKVFDSGQHPDFRHWKPDAEKSKFIKVEQIQEMIAENQRHPITSKHKVLYLEQANMLRVEGSNAILKTLEEPSAFTTIILHTDSIDNVLSTIISRCQLIPIKSLGIENDLTNFEFRQYIPKTFIEADDMANKMGKSDKDEIKQFIINLQKSIWNETKSQNFTEDEINKRVYILNRLEEYHISIESYVNNKLILENMFIDLFRVRKLF